MSSTFVFNSSPPFSRPLQFRLYPHSTKTALEKVCLALCCQIQWSVLSPLLNLAVALVTAHHFILLKLLGHFVSRLSDCPVSLPLRGCSFAVSFAGSSSSPDLLGSEWPRAQALGRLISSAHGFKFCGGRPPRWPKRILWKLHSVASKVRS